MNDDELEKLQGIFYSEGTYDFVLNFSDARPRRLRGVCDYTTKVVTVFSAETYLDGLFVILHELAHARIQHKTHSLVWEQEFVRLLRKYKYPADKAKGQAEAVGPNLKRFLAEYET